MLDASGRGVLSLKHAPKEFSGSARPERVVHALEVAGVGTWDLNLETGALFWSEAAEALFGFAAGTFPGTTEAGLSRVHPGDVPRLLTARKHALESGSPFHCDYRIHLPDGELRWVRSTGSAGAPSSSPRHFTGIVVDITAERTRAEVSESSARLLETMVDALPVATYDVDRDERLVLSNRYYREHCGLRIPTDAHRPVWDLIGETQYQQLSPFFRRVLGGEAVQLESEVERAGSTPLRVSATLIPDFGPDRRVRGFAGLSEDITERATSAAKLLESERQLRLLADVIPAMVWVTDPTGKVEYINQQWYEYTTGRREVPQSHAPWADSIHPDDLPGMLEIRARALENNTDFTFEYRIRRHDGVYRWHLMRTVVVHDLAGHAAKRFGSAIDIQDQKQTEARQRLFAETSEAMSSVRNVKERVEHAAHHALSLFGGACGVYLARDDGQLELATVAHPSPEVTQSLRENPAVAALPPSLDSLPVRAWKSGKTQTSSDYPAGAVRRRLNGVTGSETLDALGIKGLIAVPLRTDRATFGVMLFSLFDRGVEAADVPAAEELARRVAWGIDNARLFEEQERWLALLETFLASAPVGMCFVDQGLRYGLINRALADIHAVTIEAAVGAHVSAVSPAFSAAVLPLLRSILDGGGPVIGAEVELAGLSADAAPRSFRVSAYPVRAPFSEELGVFGVGMVVAEVTQEKAIRAELTDAIRARDEFLSIASHELRTPLTCLKLRLESRQRRLQHRDPTVFSFEQLDRSINQDMKQVDRLTRLIEDMLDLARINTGKLSLQPEPCDLRELVDEVNERLLDALRAAGCDVSVRSPSIPVRGRFDRFRIEQVYVNLLTNAARYAPGAPVRVELSLQHRAGGGTPDAVVRVTDTGPGIALENQERIFHRFERAAAGSNVSGMGLGLYIARQIVQAHQGSLRVESTPGEGASFVITLPTQED